MGHAVIAGWFTASAVMACSSDDGAAPAPVTSPPPEDLPSCGDGVVEGGEECEPPGGTPYCSFACKNLGSCGDGIVNGPESCDVGLQGTPQEGCRGCLAQVGYSCVGSPSQCSFGPTVDGSVPLLQVTSQQIRQICEWSTAAFGGEGAKVKCLASPTDFAAVASVDQCVRDFFRGSVECDATVAEFVACWRPVIQTPGVDFCAATGDVDRCMEKACADFVPCTDGPGCIAAPCKGATDCSEGTHCSRTNEGWCECDVPGKSWCLPPKCTQDTDCTPFGMFHCSASQVCVRPV